MRSLEEIQSGNRQAAVNANIDAIRSEVRDFAARQGFAAIDGDGDALALVRSAGPISSADLTNADRQRVNAALYAVLINYVGAAKASGWRFEQYTAGERLVELVEHAATGNTLNGGVPVGYSVPVVLPSVGAEPEVVVVDTIVEEPVAEEPVAEEPVAEEPVAEEPAVEPTTTAKGTK